MFFNKCQKTIAKRTGTFELKSAYEKSEENLRRAARSGNERELNKAMSEHRCYEYALLYKETPAYKKFLRKGGKRK